jgi:hypothetical protein
MIVYRETEIIEIIKILALGYGNRIDNETAKTVIEGYRRAVNKHVPGYQWLNAGDQEE